MSFEERNTVSGILISVISWGIMITVLARNAATGLYDGPDGPMLWARSVLWLILICIGIGIAMTILFTICYAIVTGDKRPTMLRDERDDLIGLRGIQVTLIVISIGIVAAIAALAYGLPILVALNMILAACALGDLAGMVTKLVLYRRGF
ncbi:hypothetical protein [Tabrizicola sp.]|uniref:hypothetical protein n=1 Tax=Tabrizicola sp. TaxID=2005166 RepID=UPI00286CE840|nr:hypothetical protein [Tabrizicola sp.]